MEVVLGSGSPVAPVCTAYRSQWWKGWKDCPSFSLLPAWVRLLSTPTFHSYREHYPPPGPRMVFWKLKEHANCQGSTVFSLTPQRRAKLGRVTRSHPLFLIALHPSSCVLSIFLALGLPVQPSPTPSHLGALWRPLITVCGILLTASHTELHTEGFGWNTHFKWNCSDVLFIITILLGTPNSNSLCKSLHTKMFTNIFYWNMIDLQFYINFRCTT